MAKKLFTVVAVLTLLGGIVPYAQADNVPKGIYYTINDGKDFFRSAVPWKDGPATQSQNPRHVTVGISQPDGTYADSGFVLYIGPLSGIDTIKVTGKGDPFNLNFWFDTNKDGEFFLWNGVLGSAPMNLLTILGGDGYASDNSGSVNGILSVTGTTSFYFMTAPYGNYTLSDMKSGVIPGIDGDTKVAIWVGVSGNGGAVARIDSVSINGQ
jgi:hypothetical protein